MTNKHAEYNVQYLAEQSSENMNLIVKCMMMLSTWADRKLPGGLSPVKLTFFMTRPRPDNY